MKDTEFLNEINRIFTYDSSLGLIWKKYPHPKSKGKITLGEKAGGNDKEGYRYVRVLGKKYRAHKIVWFIHYKNMPDGLIDHINGDRGDNRIENLRITTAAGNAKNRVRKNSTGMPPGVNRVKSSERYQARIQPEGTNKKIYLGTYDTSKEAAAAYIGASIVLSGEFSAYISRNIVAKELQPQNVTKLKQR